MLPASAGAANATAAAAIVVDRSFRIVFPLERYRACGHCRVL